MYTRTERYARHLARLCGALVVVSLLLAGCVAPGQELALPDERLTGTRLLLDVDSAQVEVRAWDQEAIHIRTTLINATADDYELAFEQDGDTATVHVAGRQCVGLCRRQLRLAIDVPADIALDLDVGSGRVAVSGTRGATTIALGRGPLSLSDVGGALTLHSASGAVTVEEAHATTLNVTLGRSDLRFVGSLAAGNHEITSDAGDVSLRLPPGAGVRLDARTVRGSVRATLPLTGLEHSEGYLRGVTGDGAASLTISATRGDISLATGAAE